MMDILNHPLTVFGNIENTLWFSEPFFLWGRIWEFWLWVVLPKRDSRSRGCGGEEWMAV